MYHVKCLISTDILLFKALNKNSTVFPMLNVSVGLTTRHVIATKGHWMKEKVKDQYTQARSFQLQSC